MLIARYTGQFIFKFSFHKEITLYYSPHTMEQLFHLTLISIPQTNFYKGNKESLACCQPAHYQCQMQVPVQTRLIALILVFVFLSSTAVLPHPTHVQISEYKCMNINALAVHIQRTYNYTQHYTQFGYLHWLGRPKATKSMHLPPVTHLKVIFPFIISQAFFYVITLSIPGCD